VGKRNARVETSRHGFLPIILNFDNYDERVGVMLDNAFVEYGTGCWLDAGKIDQQLTYDLQVAVWEAFKGEMPDDHWVMNTCSDHRVCYNPNCLIIVDIDEVREMGL
jgi:hypothetical protein